MRAFFLWATILLSSPAWAVKWVPFGESEALFNQAFYFYDPDTVQTNGDVRRIWTMTNVRTTPLYELLPKSLLIQEKKLGSIRNQLEINCKDATLRVLSYASFSEEMGGGSAVGDSAQFEIFDGSEDIAPGTVQDSLRRAVCKTPAYSRDWVSFHESEEATYYYHPESILRAGIAGKGVAWGWILGNLKNEDHVHAEEITLGKKKHSTPMRSFRWLAEYRCDTRTYRQRSFS